MFYSFKLMRGLVTICVLGVVSPIFALDPPPDGGYDRQNTAEGEDALFSLGRGENNTAVGYHALFATTSNNNTAVGASALVSNTKGDANVAIGVNAMEFNRTGRANVAFGVEALISNVSGLRNIAIGTESLKRVLGSDNVGLGYEAGMNVTTGSFNIDIGNMGLPTDTNLIRIGTEGVQTATYIAAVKDTAIEGTAVAITTDGQLGVIASSARFKEAIKPMDRESEAIFSLRPVQFRYKKEINSRGTPQFGLVAEEVARVNPDLVVADKEGRPFTVRYDEVNAMLLNEFQKEHQTVNELKQAIAEQKAEIEKLKSELKRQDSVQETTAGWRP